MSELRTRFERLRSHETPFEADHFRFVLFGAVLYGTGVDEIIKPLPRDFLIPNTTKPDFQLLKTHYKKLTTAPIEEVFMNPTAIILLKHIFSDERFDLFLFPVKELELNRRPVKDWREKVLEKQYTEPGYVFKLIQNGNAAKAEQFESLKRDYGSFHAFHGTPMQNVRSACEFGLVSMFNRREAYGTGVYCTDYVHVASGYAPFKSNCYEASRYGEVMRTILLIEVINHPLLSDASLSKPSHVHVVLNADWIRIDSIFLYTGYGPPETNV